MNHLISIASLGQDDFEYLTKSACRQATLAQRCAPALASRCVGLEFRKTSTRTRTSFAAAAVRLGAFPIFYGPNDLQTNTGETPSDTVAVLAKYIDVLVVRSAGDPRELRMMAEVDSLPIVNAMSADEHPTQALSDLATMQRHFGRLSGLHLLYVGEANNTAVALAYSVARTSGMAASFCTPPGYGFTAEARDAAAALSRRFGGKVHIEERPPDTRERATANVVYATRWQTTGTMKSDPHWRDRFAPYRVTERMFLDAASNDAVFMHDLPAVRGEDCDGEVLDGSMSIALFQAEQKLYTAMTVLEWCAKR